MTLIPQVSRGPNSRAANRAALLVAARAVFDAEGYDAPLSAVAKHAGVGQGTLYRHFADRTALAVALFDENITELEAIVDAPDATLQSLLSVIAEQALVSTALIDLLIAHRGEERVHPLGIRMRAIVERAVDRERASGRLAEHVDTEDVVLAISMFTSVLAHTDEASRQSVARRSWALFTAAFAPRD